MSTLVETSSKLYLTFYKSKNYFFLGMDFAPPLPWRPGRSPGSPTPRYGTAKTSCISPVSPLFLLLVLSHTSYSLELPTIQYSFIQLLNYIPLSPQDSLFSTLTTSSPLRLPLLDFHRNDHGISSCLSGASPIATLT